VSEHLLAAGSDTAVAVVDGASEFTYGDLRAAVARLAAQVRASSAPGDRVGILAPNSFFWIASYLATLATGRVAVPFPTTATPDDVVRQASWVGATTFLVHRRQVKQLGSLAPGAITIDDSAIHVENRLPSFGPADVDPDTDAVLQFTSGTTAAPKAVRVTHRNLVANTDAIVDYLGLDAADRMLVVLPFSYCYGLSLLNTHLRVGGSVALCHTLTFPETVVEAIDEHACTGFAGVPSTYQLLLKASSLGRRALPSLRHLQQAGGKLAPALVDDLAAAQNRARVFVMYGQTEATARLSYLPPEEIHRKRGSVGRGIPGQPLRVVDSDDADVGPGEVGEIVASGPSITSGYWNDPGATAEKYRGGLLRTGDLATVDDDGFVYIVDRLSDFIKSWGHRISSQEIEEATLAVPGVMSAAAVGVPDDAAGEAIVLFAVTSDPDVSGDDILGSLRGSLAKHKLPHHVRVVDELPLNANGKAVKSELREWALAVDSSDAER
jgi:acyl-CoA synthetase (AMP-forming)/AMP-acid ligase II